MRDTIKLSDEQIEKRFEDLGYGICAEELAFTAETIEDFEAARSNYSEPGNVRKRESSMIIEDAQVLKGKPRGDIVVIDFGEVRAVYR